MYFALKHLHMLCAVISIIGFIVRGALRLADSPLLQKKFLKIAPHIVDTFLLLSAIGLTISIQQYPLTTPWLTAKLIGLFVYIGLGLVALRFAKTKITIAIAYLFAIATFAYIAMVAMIKTPIFF
jgi:uncharacterized membrane protein SirB2